MEEGGRREGVVWEEGGCGVGGGRACGREGVWCEGRRICGKEGGVGR